MKIYNVTKFFDKDDNPVKTLSAWGKLVGGRNWADYRSAKRCAETWLPYDTFPKIVESAFATQDELSGIVLKKAIVEHRGSTPARGSSSATDIMVHAEMKDQKIAISVEAKVDEGFDKISCKWLTAGKSINSPENRKLRLSEMCKYLGVDPTKVEKIRYQLIHRTYSSCIEAEAISAEYAMLLIHSFSPDGIKRPGWNDFVDWARLLSGNNKATLDPNRPWVCKTIHKKTVWFLWIEDLAKPDSGVNL